VSALRTIFRYWLWLLLGLVVLQIAFAGFGAFDVVDKVATEGTSVDEESVEDSWGLHIGFGYLVLLASLITFLLALAARVGRARVLHSLGIFGLVIVQIILAWIGGSAPILGTLHPLNAFLILGAVAALTMRMWKGEAMAATRTAPEPPPAV
jgi:hypothetical protein